MADRIVVFGAGALSLGFFGPELQEEYRLTFIDTKFKEDFVSRVQRTHAYTTNVAGPAITPVTVRNVDAFRLDLPEQDAAVREHVAQARIFFTAVGVRNLDSALLFLDERLKGRREELYILCAENGEGVAEKWRARFPANIHLCDTVMGRMCRLDEHPAPDYRPVDPELPWGVVGEDLKGMPLSSENRNPEVFHSPAFIFCTPEEFHARERVKLYAHNGLHFYIAAMGALRGAERFSDLAGDAQVVAAARGVLNEEIAPALWKDCAHHIGRDEFDRYIARLPGRLFSPTLRDHVGRGIRGIVDKFADNERIMGGLRLLLANGIRPERYGDLLASGLAVAQRDVSAQAAQQICDRLPAEVRRSVEPRWRALAAGMKKPSV